MLFLFQIYIYICIFSLILRNEYVRKTANAQGPKSLALVGAGTTSIIPNLFTSLIMAVIIVLLH